MQSQAMMSNGLDGMENIGEEGNGMASAEKTKSSGCTGLSPPRQYSFVAAYACQYGETHGFPARVSGERRTAGNLLQWVRTLKK